MSKRAIQDRDDFGILLFGAFWLCFNAGFVNIVTISSYLALTSTHVTGLVAKTSIALADEDWKYLYLPATTFLCFLLGATAGGVFIRYDTFYRACPCVCGVCGCAMNGRFVYRGVLHLTDWLAD